MLQGARSGTYLKYDAHGRGHLNDLTVGQAELAIVIQHGVHVLNPERIHRPIQHQPLPGGTGIAGQLLERHSQHTILQEKGRDWATMAARPTPA